jgi:hypothetical protein
MPPLGLADNNKGGGVEPMREQSNGNVTIQHEQPAGWFNWAERHPGIVLLGCLAMAILALQESPMTDDIERNTSCEEVPLFI